MNTITVEPFAVSVEDSVVERIRRRLIDAHWSLAPVDDTDWVYGTDITWLRNLVDHWINAYDWRAAERKLNQWPQFFATVGSQRIHYYHVRGSASRSRPMLLTHGWPGSVVEFIDCIERLTYPERYGGDPEQGFDLVIPSLPGYGFSAPPSRPMRPREVASLWRELMVDVLGYDNFVAQGGDWGAVITSWLGADHPDVVRAIHINMLPSWFFPASEQPGVEEQTYQARVAAVRASEMGYFVVQTTRPQTLAIALSDSPLGFAAWVCEKFRNWGDTHGNIGSRFTYDLLITNLMLYLVNDNVGPALWMYRGRAEECAPGNKAPFVRVPTGVACFPSEIIPYPPRDVAERVYAITRWTHMSAGGHFAALEEPQVFSEEVRVFFQEAGF